MIKRKLRPWVLQFIVAASCIIIVGGLYIIGDIVNQTVEGPSVENVTDIIIDETQPVNKEIEITTIKPYSSKEVTVAIDYYDYSSDESKQQQSLIYYENIYLQNSGILYSSEENFAIIASIDGTVKEIKEDDILGSIIIIEHSPSIITYYQSVTDISVKIGDTVKQGQVIAQSGPNNIEGTKDYNLHFQVFKDGKIINPEEFYQYKETISNNTP